MARADHVPCQAPPDFVADHVPSKAISLLALSNVHDPRAVFGVADVVSADQLPRMTCAVDAPAVADHVPR